MGSDKLGRLRIWLLFANESTRLPVGAGLPAFPYGVPTVPPNNRPHPRLVAITLDAELQRRKLFALECMHDLRPAPLPATGSTAGYSDYLRQAVRSEEIFYACPRSGFLDLVRQFLRDRKT